LLNGLAVVALASRGFGYKVRELVMEDLLIKNDLYNQILKLVVEFSRVLFRLEVFVERSRLASAE
jgi:hypothetical protein